MQKLEDAVRKAYAAHVRAKQQGHKDAARTALKDPTTPATVVLIAAEQILGPLQEFREWEPDTLWSELGDVPQGARDKLLAAISLDTTPSFYWDFRVLGAVAQAFNDEQVATGALAHLQPAELAWGVWEAELIYGLTDSEGIEPFFEDENVSYVAALLHDAGWVKAPSFLSFADERLEELLSPIGKEVRSKMKDTPEAADDDSPEGVQHKNLHQLNDYMQEKADALLSALEPF